MPRPTGWAPSGIRAPASGCTMRTVVRRTFPLSPRHTMSLQSKLFRGDPKLEACLVKDPDHITAGAVGEHVAKIQSALSQIENAHIQQNELAGKTYGSSTAAAVLAFKRQRQIINRS